MKIRIQRHRVPIENKRVGQENFTDLDIGDVGLDDEDIIGAQYIAFPAGPQHVEFISISHVMDDDDKKTRERIEAQLTEDILGGLEAE